MKLSFLMSAILASAVTLSACSSTPLTTPKLDMARGEFIAANNTPQIAAFAPLEFKQASDALELANAAAARKDSLDAVDQLAYIASQKIATARYVAKTKAAEADVAAAARQRDQVRLDARTAEAERAKLAAANAQAQAANAQAQTADAQRQAADAEAQRRAAEAQASDAQAKAADAQAKAAQLEAMLADLQAKKTERGMVITIGDILFATGQATLTPAGLATVRKLADVLVANPTRNVLIEGFTDSVGGTQYNQALSERRANALAAALTEMGITRERIAMRGYGEAYPVASNATAGERQLNRRVEIVLSNDASAIPMRR